MNGRFRTCFGCGQRARQQRTYCANRRRLRKYSRNSVRYPGPLQGREAEYCSLLGISIRLYGQIRAAFRLGEHRWRKSLPRSFQRNGPKSAFDGFDGAFVDLDHASVTVHCDPWFPDFWLPLPRTPWDLGLAERLTLKSSSSGGSMWHTRCRAASESRMNANGHNFCRVYAGLVSLAHTELIGAELTKRRSDVNYIGQLERAEKRPTLATLISFCMAFDTAASDFICAAEFALHSRPAFPIHSSCGKAIDGPIG